MTSRLALAFLVASLASVSCVSSPPSGVAIQGVSSDISFGVKLPEDKAAPANLVPPGQVPYSGTNLGDESSFRRRFFEPPRARAEPCPTAPVNAFAPEKAPDNARGMPEEGTYRWKYQGTIETLTGSAPRKIPFGGFERRQVTDVSRISENEFSFVTLQREFSGEDIVRTTWKVRTDAVQQRPPGVPDRRVGEPDRGLAVSKIERLDGRTGGIKSEFTPNPAVLALPLPVFQGERYQATGVDPSSGDSYSIDGFVPKRQLVDACGKLIDGWKLEATRTFSSGTDASSRTSLTGKWHAVFATQNGALPISERVEFQTEQARFEVTFTIGQLEPDR